MNKLCCLLNPSIICRGCDTYWCDPCDYMDIVRWSRKEFNHHVMTNGWACPNVKGYVTYTDPIGRPLELIPHEQKKEASSSD